MKIYLLLICSAFIFNACISTKNIKQLRYDGIYKKISGSKVIYTKFEKNKNEWNSISFENENDNKAIRKLDILSKNKYSQKYFYRNDEKEVDIYWSKGNGTYDGAMQKNKNGEIRDSLFIKTANGKIKEIIDLRVINKYSLYSIENNLISDKTFEYINIINKQYAIVKQNYKFGILDINKNEIIGKINYQWINKVDYNNTMTAFKQNNKYGFFDKNYNVAIQAQYDEVKSISYKGYFIDGIQAVKSNNKWIIIDKNNKKVINEEFDNVGEYISKEFVPIYKKDKGYYHFINLKTKKYTDIKAYSNNVLYKYNILDIGGKQEIIFDKQGNRIFNFKFDNIFPFVSSDNKTYFQISNKSFNKKGIIDKTGNLIIPYIFSDINFLKNKSGIIKYFEVNDSSRYRYKGLYNTKGNLILPIKFNEISIFNEEKKYFLGKISKNNSSISSSIYYIYKENDNTPLFSAEYIWKIHKDDKYAMFMQKGLYGIIDLNLNIVVKANYRNILDIKKDFYAIYYNGESKIYKIGQKDKLFEVEGRIDFLDKYITVNNGNEDSIYDYKFNKLNKKDILSTSICYENTNILVIKNIDKEWAVIKKNKLYYFKEKYEEVNCNMGDIIIIKIK